MPKTFPIYHPEHGEAIADENTDLPGFIAAGWSKTKPKAKPAGKPGTTDQTGTPGTEPAGTAATDHG